MSTTPRRLGKYELQKLLGRGSTGEVWQGYDYAARSAVAVKLLHPDLLQTDPNFMNLFMQIWQPLLSLHHPNIVQVREANISRPSESMGMTPYIVMDYVDGQATLASSIQRTSRAGHFPPVAEIVYLFTSLGLAIDYAHEQGIVHGDIKPTNILLDTHDTAHLANGEPLLTDFGIASLPGHKSNASPSYLSPEQAKGIAVQPGSDIYALGVLLYEICTGVLPFHGESSIAILMHHINTLPTPPMLINPHIPPELSEVILRALAKDPETRFATASLLATAIAEACSIEQAAQVTLNKRQSSSGELQNYPTSGPLLAPGSQPQTAPNMTTILGVSGPLPNIPVSHPVMSVGPALSRDSGYLPEVSQRRALPSPAVTEEAQRLPALQTQTAGRLTAMATSVTTPAIPPEASSPRSGDYWKLRSNNVLSPIVMMIVVLLLLLVVVGSLGVSLLLHAGSNQTAAPVADSAIGHAFFQDDALGHDDLLRIELQNIPTPPTGKRYYAWSQNVAGTAVLLGPLSIQNGSATLLYTGDAHHTNLLASVKGVFVTLENDGQTPPHSPTVAAKVYQAVFAGSSFQYIQHILYQLPNFPLHSSLIAGLFETIRSMNDKAGSIVDSLQSTHDYVLAQRQAIRVVELIDGSQYARDSGHLPASLPSLLSAPVGLISSPSQAGYIDTLAQQIQKVISIAGDNANMRQHAQNVSNALSDLRTWIQQLRSYDLQILKAANLADATNIGVALQLKQIAEDAYTGRTIPPNQGPLPILGSAGAYQAYVECQYMATLDIQKVA